LKKRNKSYVGNVKMKIFVERWGKDFQSPLTLTLSRRAERGEKGREGIKKEFT
jgi:hypothetical protein